MRFGTYDEKEFGQEKDVPFLDDRMETGKNNTADRTTDDHKSAQTGDDGIPPYYSFGLPIARTYAQLADDGKISTLKTAFYDDGLAPGGLPIKTHHVVVGFDDPNQVDDDTADSVLDDFDEDAWADGDEAHCSCGCCCSCDVDIDRESPDDYDDDCVADLYDFYKSVLDKYYEDHEGCENGDGSWKTDDDPIEELASRLEWISTGIRSGEVDLPSAMDAIDNVYDGIEDDLNEIVRKGDPSCSCGHGAADGFDSVYHKLYYKLTQLSWYLNSLKKVKDLTEDDSTDPDVNASKAGLLIETLTRFITDDDLLVDALQNPESDSERDFGKACLEEDCAETVGLLAHSKTNYVVGYAIRNWLDRFGDQVIGGLESITGDFPKLRELGNGRLIVD